MQAQKEAPQDMQCNDKFLLQSVTTPKFATGKEITRETVKTTNPKKYCVRPNIGIVLPGATCDVTVTMQAQKEAPQDMQCKDKFLIESVKAPNGATRKDITPEMFNKEIWKVVKEFKLRAAYVPANPLVPEGSVEGSSPRASGVENGNQGTSLFDAKKRPTNLQNWIKNMNKEKNIPGKVITLLGIAKTKIGSQFELRNREKAIMAGYIELPNEEKLILASERTQLKTDVELLNKEKAKLQSDKDRLKTDIELLKKEKDTLHKALNEEKAEDFQLGWTVGKW